MDLSGSTIAIIAATFLLAGLVKGVTGMGLPTVAMGVLGGILGPVTAAGLLVVPTLVTNLWQLAAGPHKSMLARRLWTMTLATFAGTIAGTFILTSGNTRIVTGALGVVLVVYAAYTLLAPTIHVAAKWERFLSPVMGLATGALAGATGVSVVPAAPYLASLGLKRDELIQALGLSFTTSTLALGLALRFHGALAMTQLTMSSLALAPAFAGMIAGQWLRARISPPTFRRAFLICLFALGMEMIVHSFT